MFADLTLLEYMSDVAPDFSEDELRNILRISRRFPNWECRPRSSAAAASSSSVRNDKDAALRPSKDEQRILAAEVVHSLDFTIPGGEMFADLNVLDYMSDAAPDLSEDELRSILRTLLPELPWREMREISPPSSTTTTSHPFTLSRDDARFSREDDNDDD